MNAEAFEENANGITRLVVVDDHDLAREGLMDMLADEPDIAVIGDAANGREALSLCAKLRPDLVLMDVRMPKMDGLAATRAIKQVHPRISILMVTMHENPDYLLEALRAGASGYVLKDAARHEIVTAVRQVRDGDSPLDPALAVRVLKRLAIQVEGAKTTTHRDPRVEAITPRELEVLELMKLGGTNREIADKLWISLGTAKNHVEHIISKLEVSDRTQAVVVSLELGILELHSEQ